MAYRELYSGGPDMYKLYLSDSNGNPDPSNAYVQVAYNESDGSYNIVDMSGNDKLIKTYSSDSLNVRLGNIPNINMRIMPFYVPSLNKVQLEAFDYRGDEMKFVDVKTAMADRSSSLSISTSADQYPDTYAKVYAKIFKESNRYAHLYVGDQSSTPYDGQMRTCVNGIQCQPVERYNANLDNTYPYYIEAVFNYKGDNTFFLKSCGAVDNPSKDIYETSVNIAYRVSSPSSKRFKENIEYLDDNDVLNKLIQVTPCTFNYIGNPDYNIGVIAEELTEIFPNLVKFDQSGNPNSVIYSDFIPLLISACRAQQKEIDTLKTKINELDEKLNQLEK